MNKVFTENAWKDYAYWSRRINEKDRLVYKIDEKNVYILSCRFHCNDN